MKRLAVALLLAMFAVLSAGCSKGCGKSAGSGRTRVLVSIFPVYDLTRRIAGPDADVTLLLPPGRDAQGFEATMPEGAPASDVKLAVMVGLGLDAWTEKLAKDAAPNARILKVGDRVPTLPLEGAAANPDALDPNVWLDPQRAQLMARAIAEELGRVDAPHALAYRERATALDASLAALDKEVEQRTKALAARGLVTQRGSFRYFAERYELEILAVIQPVPGAPPSAEHQAKVLAVVKDEKVRVIFREPQVDPGPARALAEAAQLPLGTLDPLGGGPETGTYEQLIRFDVTRLEEHLR